MVKTSLTLQSHTDISETDEANESVNGANDLKDDVEF